MLGYQVTLTTNGINYNLLALVRAIDPTFIDRGDIVIQINDDGGAQVFKIGDDNLSDTRYGGVYRCGDFTQHFLSLGGVYARCDTDGKMLNIAVVRA